jgi:hypothetical protein
MKYALDAEHNLVPGDDLTFAYQGSGVATFVDGAGTGFRIPIGVRNLAGVDSDGTVYLESGAEPQADETPGEDYAAPVAAYDELMNRELEALCDKRGVEFKYHPNKAALVGLLTDADQKAG